MTMRKTCVSCVHDNLDLLATPCDTCDNFSNWKPKNIMEAVDGPKHYTFSKIEPIDAIEAWGLNFKLANVVKYVARAQHKGKYVEDLKKARWYLDREISQHDNNV